MSLGQTRPSDSAPGTDPAWGLRFTEEGMISTLVGNLGDVFTAMAIGEDSSTWLHLLRLQ